MTVSADARAQWESWHSIDRPMPEAAAIDAATTLERHVSGRGPVSPDDLVWSATVLLVIAAAVTEQRRGTFAASVVGDGARRAAARGLRYLLLPAASDVRRELGVDDPDDLVDLCASVTSPDLGRPVISLVTPPAEVWAVAL